MAIYTIIFKKNDGFVEIAGAIQSSSSVTYTTQSNHGFNVGDRVKISGIVPATLNTSSDPGAAITSITKNTFTIESSVTDSYVSGGTASVSFVGTINSAGRPTYATYLATPPSNPPGPLPVELALNSINTRFVRNGFTLDGWSYSEDGDKIELFNPVVGTDSYTVYALWRQNFYDNTDESESAFNADTKKRTQAEENKLVNKALTKYPVPYLSGLKLQADIKLGNLVLNTIDEDNVVWVCTDIEGWWNFPEPELPELIRGWGDGSYDAKGRWASRSITLNGVFLTQDPSQVPAARAKLIEAANLVYRGGWLVVNEGPQKGAFVRLSGRPDISTVSPRGRTQFSIGLKAADPIKYEYVDGVEDGYRIETLTPSAASKTITNTGNTPVPIIIELSKGFAVANPSNPPKITNAVGDQVMNIIGGTTANNQLEIDTYNREVLDVEYDDEEPTRVVNVENGRAKLSVLSDWIYLEPGANLFTIANFPAGSSCTIYYRSGWIG